MYIARVLARKSRKTVARQAGREGGDAGGDRAPGPARAYEPPPRARPELPGGGAARGAEAGSAGVPSVGELLAEIELAGERDEVHRLPDGVRRDGCFIKVSYKSYILPYTCLYAT